MAHSKEDIRWSFERKITLSSLLSAITSLIVVVGLVVSLDARIGVVESRYTVLVEEMRQARQTAMHVERIDERIAAMQQMLAEIKQDLRRD